MTVGLLAARDDVRVGRDKSGPTTEPLPSCTREHAGASTFTVDRATCCAVSPDSPLAAGGAPMSGAGPKPSNTRGPSDATKRLRGVGRVGEVVLDERRDRGVARLLRRPLRRLGEDRQQEPVADEHADHAGGRAAGAVDASARCRSGSPCAAARRRAVR